MGQGTDSTGTCRTPHRPLATAVAVFTSSIWLLHCSSHSQHNTHTLCAAAWHSALRSHPNQRLVEFMLNGICNGFCIGLTNLPSSLKAARSNLEEAREHPDIVTDYLDTEISLYRVAGPFPPKAVPQLHISHFGVIPKGQTGRWRLIVDLSHPSQQIGTC